MIGINQFEAIMTSIEKHEKILDALWETEVISLECPLQNIVTDTLNALADDFVESATKEIEGIDIGEIIFNWCYQFQFGQHYLDYLNRETCLVTVGHTEYKPQTSRQLYDTIIALTQQEEGTLDEQERN